MVITKQKTFNKEAQKMSFYQKGHLGISWKYNFILVIKKGSHYFKAHILTNGKIEIIISLLYLKYNSVNIYHQNFC